MEQSVSTIARNVVENLRNSFFQGRGGYYERMDQDSDSEEDNTISDSLFYSANQVNEDSIPLTLSNNYSDRSQLLYDQTDSDGIDHSTSSDYEENPKPSAIYLNQPEPPYSNPKSLSESLLPNYTTVPKGFDMSVNRKYQDPIFTLVYIVCFSVFLVSGIIITFTTSSHALEDRLKGSVFATMKESAGLLTIIIATTIIIGVIWMYVLRKFTKTFVQGIVIVIPVTLTAVFIWTLVESLQSYYVYEGNTKLKKSDIGLAFVSIVTFMLNLLYVKLMYSNRDKISKTISVIHLASDIIKLNSGAFVISLLLIIAFVIFSAIWMIFFTRLWLVGHLKNSSNLGPVWIVDNYVYSLSIFYLFIFMWTSKLLVYMERFILSAITAQWFFHRNEPTASSAKYQWKVALHRACTTSFGTLAFGSGVISIIQTLQFFASIVRKYSESSKPFASILSRILLPVDAIVDIFSKYTVYLSGITGESFLSAASSATKILRRNLLSGLFGDFLTQLILYVAAGVIALISGIITYIYATHHLHSPHGIVIGIIGTLFPWYLSQFFSYILMSIVEASFLCYAIDLDTGIMHYPEAHTVFSGFD